MSIPEQIARAAAVVLLLGSLAGCVGPPSDAAGLSREGAADTLDAVFELASYATAGTGEQAGAAFLSSIGTGDLLTEGVLREAMGAPVVSGVYSLDSEESAFSAGVLVVARGQGGGGWTSESVWAFDCVHMIVDLEAREIEARADDCPGFVGDVLDGYESTDVDLVGSGLEVPFGG